MSIGGLITRIILGILLFMGVTQLVWVAIGGIYYGVKYFVDKIKGIK